MRRCEHWPGLLTRLLDDGRSRAARGVPAPTDAENRQVSGKLLKVEGVKT